MKQLDRLGFSIESLENVKEAINEALKRFKQRDFNEYGLDLINILCHTVDVIDKMQEDYDELDERRYKVLNSIEALYKLKDDLFKVQDLDDDDITEDLKDFIDDEIDEFENALNGKLKDLDDELDDLMIELLSDK